MNKAPQIDILKFSTDRVERLVLGWACIVLGGGALAFWNVQRSAQGPLVMLLLIGAFFLGLGIFLIGFRRAVCLEAETCAREIRTFFGKILSQKYYQLSEFEAVGCHGATTELLYLDVALFKKGGGFVVLRTMVSDAEAKREIDRVAQYLGLPAEIEPRTLSYLIGGLDLP